MAAGSGVCVGAVDARQILICAAGPTAVAMVLAVVSGSGFVVSGVAFLWVSGVSPLARLSLCALGTAVVGVVGTICRRMDEGIFRVWSVRSTEGALRYIYGVHLYGLTYGRSKE